MGQFKTEKYKNKYRIESNRLRGWDYSEDGYYFITLVSADRHHVFGEIIDDTMLLSHFGEIAHKEWLNSFDIRQELFLDEFIIMPNHLHAIVILQKPPSVDIHNLSEPSVETHGRALPSASSPSVQRVETHGRASLPSASSPSFFVRKPKSISSFVAGYKSTVIHKIDNYIDDNHLETKKYNRRNPLWQSNYHDHIIRNEKSYQHISHYIRNNPSQWDEDSLNKDLS